MTTIAEIFDELLFGSGFWIGLIFIISICIIISYRFKYSGVIFEVILFFMALEYYDNLAVDSNKMWGLILCFVTMIFIVAKMISDAKN
jgi:hypothetical protein